MLGSGDFLKKTQGTGVKLKFSFEPGIEILTTSKRRAVHPLTVVLSDYSLPPISTKVLN